jgi:type VII secretion integral membrane protein EccD
MDPEQDLCRVTVTAPHRRADLAVPLDVPFAQLLPTIGAGLGIGRDEAGGWVLQRMDEPPFAEGDTPEQVSLRDGEVLYLRPATTLIPPVAYDDIADVIASGVTELPGRWRRSWTRAATLTATVGTALAAGALILLAGPPWTAPAGVAGGIAVALIALATVAYRAYGDRTAGTVFGAAGLAHAFLAGLLATADGSLGADQLLVGLGSLTVAGAIAAVAVGTVLPAFSAITLAAGAGLAAVAAGVWIPQASAPGVAAVTMVVTLALTPLIPPLAFRAARISLPDVTQDAEGLRRETLAGDSETVLLRTVRADRFVTGVVLAQAGICAAAVLPLALSDTLIDRIGCVVFGCALLLRARIFRGGAQRLALLLAALLGPLVLAGAVAVHGSQTVILAGILPAVLAVGAAIVGAEPYLNGGSRTRYFARAADLLDLLVIVALIPLVLGITGVFGQIS